MMNDKSNQEATAPSPKTVGSGKGSASSSSGHEVLSHDNHISLPPPPPESLGQTPTGSTRSPSIHDRVSSAGGSNKRGKVGVVAKKKTGTGNGIPLDSSDRAFVGFRVHDNDDVLHDEEPVEEPTRPGAQRVGGMTQDTDNDGTVVWFDANSAVGGQPRPEADALFVQHEAELVVTDHHHHRGGGGGGGEIVVASAVSSPHYDKQDEDDNRVVQLVKRQRKMFWMIGLLIILVVVVLIAVVVGITVRGGGSGNEDSGKTDINEETASPTFMVASSPRPSTPAPSLVVSTTMPTLAPTSVIQGTKDFIISRFPSSGPALSDQSSPQFKALSWLVGGPLLSLTGDDDLERILQLYSLATFYFSTGGDSTWRATEGWLVQQNECDWLGVLCGNTTSSTFSVVMSLSLSSNGLNGTIPSDLAILTNLTSLALSFNNVTGNIPSHIGSLLLPGLSWLDLSSNKMNGAIPSQLGSLSGSLRRLHLGFNDITGTIPSELGLLSRLTRLDLRENDIAGTIPSELGLLSSRLIRVHLYRNRITGTLPTELGQLSKLTWLGIFSNDIHGTIPTELAKPRSLVWLSLGINSLTGTIPSELGLLSMLTWLYLNNNALTGAIPTDLGLLSMLTELFLQNNALNGTVPPPLCNVQDISIRVDCEKVICACCNPQCAN